MKENRFYCNMFLPVALLVGQTASGPVVVDAVVDVDVVVPVIVVVVAVDVIVVVL
jgi:hypothetical protein